MKLSKLLKFVVGVMAIVAFIMMFTTQVVKTIDLSITKTVIHLNFDEVLFNVTTDSGNIPTNGATLSFIGYLAILLGGIVVVITAIWKNRFVNFISILSGIVMLAGGVLVFLTVEIWKGANPDSLTSMLMNVGTLTLDAGPVVAGILGVVGGIGACLASVLDLQPAPKKKRKK